MIIKLQNKFLEVGVNTLGAELEYINKDGVNRLWSRCDVWSRQSPILFPMVARTRNGEYFYNDKKYLMKENHGFANKSEFSVLESSDTLVKLVLTHSKETLEIYPFKFKFIVSYYLENNSIKTTWDVLNTDDKELLFNVGGHPGFSFDCNDRLTYKDYIVEFDTPIEYEIYNVINNELDQMIKYGDDIKEVNMTELIKKHNTVIFKNVTNATMKSKDKSIRIDCTTPYLAFWHNDEAKFLCIEPWCGLPEKISHNQHLEDKFEVIKLKENGNYINGYTITID